MIEACPQYGKGQKQQGVYAKFTRHIDINFRNACGKYANKLSFIGNAIAISINTIALLMHETSFSVNEIAFSVFKCVYVKVLFAFSVFRASFSVSAIMISMNEVAISINEISSLINEVSFSVFVNRISVLAIAIAGFEVMLFVRAIVFLGAESNRPFIPGYSTSLLSVERVVGDRQWCQPKPITDFSPIKGSIIDRIDDDRHH